MSITRSTGAFLGTNTNAGITITNGSTNTGSLLDLLGDNASTGEVEIYFNVTSTVTNGSMDITVVPGWEANNGTIQYTRISLFCSYAPTNGTQNLYIGRIPAARFMGVTVKNNATTTNATNTSVLYALTKIS
jgi:hypothetical protein